MRTRLIAAFLAIALAILVTQDIPLALYLRKVERNNMLLALERDAWGVANGMEPLMARGAFAAMGDLADAYAEQSLARVEVVDESATVLASTKSGELGYDYGNRPEIVAALAGDAVTGERDSVLLGGYMLFVTVPIRSGAEVAGALRLTYPVASVDAIVSQRLRSLYLTGALTLLVSITAAVLLAGAYTRRLRRIHAATEQLAGGDLSARLTEQERGAPELRDIESSFNLMATRLQTLVESQRAFASDASHQLRTPLTALRLRLENAQETVRDGHLTESAIEAAVVEVQRLQVLVDGLLALARLEGREAGVVEQEVAPILRERLDLWGPLAEERGVTLECRIPEGLRVLAAEGTLEHVLDSYLDNALEFAPAGSRIDLGITARDHAVEFHVVDAGPGMSEADRARAFDRFWRGRADGSGTGLGLAIAARMAEVSRGQVRLDAASPQGIDAVLVLNRAAGSR